MIEKLLKLIFIFIPLTIIYFPCFLIVNYVTPIWSKLLKEIFAL